MKDSTFPALLQNLLDLLATQRPAFRQERTFLRAFGLFFAELFVFARHTVTQQLLALGLTDADWSAWYRLFSRPRFDPQQASQCLFRQTLPHAPTDQPYVIGIDTTHLPRSSQKMPGTSWVKGLLTAPFRPGIQRAQRFLNLSWLVPLQDGFSRAIPLAWLPAFPAKAVPARVPAGKDWEVGLAAIRWVRGQLDAAGRQGQGLLVLVDGGLERGIEFWKGLPGRTVLLGRTARNRALYELPRRAHCGRPPEYGPHAPQPWQWLRQRSGWQTTQLVVRGRLRELTYRVEGPFLREGFPQQPVFLVVVKGIDRHVHGHRVKRDPAFYLVSAIQQDGPWVLPFPADILLSWAWQRWELEVEHREIKTNFGLGDKQCWHPRSAVTSVQWSAWAYGLLVLAGYRTWGLCGGPTSPARWWRGSERWSFNTLWRAYRTALWNTPDFQAVWTGSGDNWLKKGDWFASLWNSVTGAAR